MNKYIVNSIFTVVFLLLLSSCGSNKEVEQQLFDEVMQVHDEVMPQMGKLRNLSKTLAAMADTLALDSANDHEERIRQMRTLSEKLKKANEGMMDWMRQFEQVEEGTPHGEVIKYLKEQQELIRQVRDDMINSKSEAEKYLLENS